MKTISQIDALIKEQFDQREKDGRNSLYDLKKRNSLEAKSKKTVVFLKQVKLYLESNPREDFVKEEIKKFDGAVERITTAYRKASEKQPDPEILYKNFCKGDADLKKYRKYLKTLRFILVN